MSNTKRKDYYVEAYGSPLFGKRWKATSDKKKWYKPGMKAKKYLLKARPGNRIKMNRAMQKLDEDNEIILPEERITDRWYYT
jgi:hypothetical protein